MWGSRANKSDVWENVRRGDRLLFYTDKRFVAVAQVTAKRKDEELADAVWSPEPDSWQNVLFLRDVRMLNVPVATVAALLGYQANWSGPREFFIPTPRAQASALGDYDGLDDLIASLSADTTLGNGARRGESYADVVGRVASDADVKALIERFRAKNGKASPRAKRTTVERIERDARLILELKDLYDGHCQVCDDTFVVKATGKNYCEGAHIVPLSRRLPGIDSYLNIVILCATCHKKLDHGGMRVYWDPDRKQACWEWQGRRRRLLHNKHIHTGWEQGR